MGTGNGLMVIELAQTGFTQITGTDYLDTAVSCLNALPLSLPNSAKIPSVSIHSQDSIPLEYIQDSSLRASRISSLKKGR